MNNQSQGIYDASSLGKPKFFILGIQHLFAMFGATVLVPLITGLDVSTISRVANSKYIQTDFGIYPLKWFFSDSIKTDSGEEVSSREVKSILEEAVRNENKQSPLNDEALADILQKKGYQVARRTVAKYREKMGIPVARMRKEL